MKKKPFTILTVASLIIASTAMFLSCSGLGLSLTKIQVDDIIDKHIEAIGSMDVLMKVHAIKVEGNLNAQGYDIPFTRITVQDKGYRQTISVMGTDGFTIVRQDSGWNYMPFLGHYDPEPMHANELRMMQDELDVVDNFVNYKAKGSTAEYVGTEDIDGKECPVVTLTFKNGITKTFYFDPITYNVIRIISKRRVQGIDIDLQIDYSDFEKLPEGFVIAKKADMEMANITINKVEVNPVVNENLFNP